MIILFINILDYVIINECHQKEANEVDIILVIMLVIVQVILIVMIFYLIQKQRQTAQQVEHTIREQMLRENGGLYEKLIGMNHQVEKELYAFRTQFQKSVTMDFEAFNTRIDQRIFLMQKQIDEKLHVNLESSHQTFSKIIERLTIIDQAQQKIDALSTNIMSLQDILNDKKARGTFGEIQLHTIFQTVFGKNDRIYKMQYSLPNQTIADLILFAPEPLGNIAIDAKFPLENYQLLIQNKQEQQKYYEKLFKQDMKKHIDAIQKKYIIPGVTAEYAILFLPAEAIFSYIYAYTPEIVEYAYQKQVWLVSPTTLMAILSTLQAVLRNMERDKYADVIKQELIALSKEFMRYESRWENLVKHLDQVTKDVKDVSITSNKITKKFHEISEVQLPKHAKDLE